jgi:hypothetical protein
MPDVCVYRLRNWVYLCNVGLLLTDEDGMMSDTKFTNGKLIISNPTEKRASIYIEDLCIADVWGIQNGVCHNANAKRIVKCWSYHERLVEALNELLEFEGDYSPNEIRLADTCANARSVLTELKKDQPQ